MDVGGDRAEYPFQALLRERNSAARFVHTGVESATERYAPATAAHPCAVFCMDCIGKPKKMELYEWIGPPVEVGQFVLFLARGPTR
jgi:hypothetical protein